MIRKAVLLDADSIGVAYAPSEQTLTVKARGSRHLLENESSVSLPVRGGGGAQYHKPEAVLVEDKAERDAVRALSTSKGALTGGDCKQS